MGGRKLLVAALLLSSGAAAQDTIHNDESLSSTRPEAWAMNYVVASTFLTSFGQTPTIAPWHFVGAAELGHIPRLSESDQRVGFEGVKQEDLNRSPVFGRLRLLLGLPDRPPWDRPREAPSLLEGRRPSATCSLLRTVRRTPNAPNDSDGGHPKMTPIDKDCSAASYSPTSYRVQYHWRWLA